MLWSGHLPPSFEETDHFVRRIEKYILDLYYTHIDIYIYHCPAFLAHFTCHRPWRFWASLVALATKMSDLHVIVPPTDSSNPARVYLEVTLLRLKNLSLAALGSTSRASFFSLADYGDE